MTSLPFTGVEHRNTTGLSSAGTSIIRTDRQCQIKEKPFIEGMFIVKELTNPNQPHTVETDPITEGTGCPRVTNSPLHPASSQFSTQQVTAPL